MNGERDFDVYKLLVEEVREARKARRELSNVFTSLNLAGVGALGFLRANDGEMHGALLGWAAFALILTCVVWRLSNAYYTRLLAAKYTVIYDYEQRLGEHPLRREYEALGDRRLFNFFSVERLMPILFILGYVVFVAYSVTPGELREIVVDQPLRLAAWARGLL